MKKQRHTCGESVGKVEPASSPSPRNLDLGAPAARPSRRLAFSLIEIMLVVALMSLIMVALMAVFNSTQTAFRASITQTDVLEGSRAAMDLMTSDFRQMYPSGGNNGATETTSYLGVSSFFDTTLPPTGANGANVNQPTGPINFWVSEPMPTIPQNLIGATIPGTSTPATRTNQVQSVFILTYENQLWHGVGYFVDTNSLDYIDPLYRYDSNLAISLTNLPARPTPLQIFTNFCSVVAFYPNCDTNPYVNKLLSGVLSFNVRAYDPHGLWLTNGFTPAKVGDPIPVPANSTFYNTASYNYNSGESSFFMCSNTLPASVEIQLGVLEDRTLQRANSLSTNGVPSPRTSYIMDQAGKVHLFRQRVTIPNVDITAYAQ